MKESPINEYMSTLLNKVFDLLFPPSESEILLRSVTTNTINRLYKQSTHKNTLYLSDYSDPLVRTAITENKFHHHSIAANVLGLILNKWISTQPDNAIYIPIPLSAQRLRERGHNQVETILRASGNNIKIINDLLVRSRDTEPQTHLNKTEREKNITGAFECKNIDRISIDTQIVLVDDVVTTGATLDEAERAIKKQLPHHKIILLAVAH